MVEKVSDNDTQIRFTEPKWMPLHKLKLKQFSVKRFNYEFFN
jgi:hypothetical protein